MPKKKRRLRIRGTSKTTAGIVVRTTKPKLMFLHKLLSGSDDVGYRDGDRTNLRKANLATGAAAKQVGTNRYVEDDDITHLIITRADGTEVDVIFDTEDRAKVEGSGHV